MNPENTNHNENGSGKVPILGDNINQAITPEEDETQKNRIQVDLPLQWKCPWCELTVFDEVTTTNSCEARSCYKCKAIGVVGKINETDHIIDTGMALHDISDDIIKAQGSDRVHGLSEQGLEMKSGYLEMEEHQNEGTQGLWFRSKHQ